MTLDWKTPLAALQAAISGVASVFVRSPGGSGYTAPVVVTLGPPPAGGVQATATAVMGVGGVTIGNAAFKHPLGLRYSPLIMKGKYPHQNK